MAELKLVTVYYISINYHDETLETIKGTCVLLIIEAVHEPSNRNSKQTQVKDQKKDQTLHLTLLWSATSRHYPCAHLLVRFRFFCELQ